MDPASLTEHNPSVSMATPRYVRDERPCALLRNTKGKVAQAASLGQEG